MSSRYAACRRPERLPSRPRTDCARMVCQAAILPAIEALTADPIPKSEQVLPLDVIRPARRKYLERVVIQANGSYEHKWYDACSVMIRRIVETLIIELYEAKGRASDVKDARNGEYLMLSGLISTILKDAAWHLGRETKGALPEVKTLGDRSAHNRYYLATKQDIDRVIPGLRIIADELLSLSGLK
jgi:hypothetical protein